MSLVDVSWDIFWLTVVSVHPTATGWGAEPGCAAAARPAAPRGAGRCGQCRGRSTRTPPQLAGNYYFRLCCVLSSWWHDTRRCRDGRRGISPLTSVPWQMLCVLSVFCPGCGAGPCAAAVYNVTRYTLVTVTTPATLISNHDTRNKAFHALHFRVALSSRYNYNLKSPGMD